MIHDFIVIGAGASGLFFAATRGREPGDLFGGASAKNCGGRNERRDQKAQGSKAKGCGGAAAEGSVLLLEHQERAGRKLLLSGGGKCNVTNLSVTPDNYVGGDPAFCRPALRAFSPEKMLGLLRQNRIELEEREHGQIFCRRGAEEVRDLLQALAESNNAGLLTGQQIESVQALHQGWKFTTKGAGASAQPDRSRQSGQPTNAALSATPSKLSTSSSSIQPASTPDFDSASGSFNSPVLSGSTGANGTNEGNHPESRFVVRANGKEYICRKLLISTGNRAWPRAGASAFGLQLAQAAGHSIAPTRPGLTPFKMPPDWPLHGLQGLSLEVETVVNPATAGRKGIPHFKLPLLFTHHGLSGPACLQASSYLEYGDMLQVDFLPGCRLEELLDDKAYGKSSIQSVLRGLLPERLLTALLDGAGLSELKARRIAELSRAIRNRAADAVHRHRVKPEQPGFGQAESTVGGVSTSEINAKTMESKICPGLFFTGEVLDVCGQLGGYNLHWAWASAWLAGRV